jgi:hypothetical protein
METELNGDRPEVTPAMLQAALGVWFHFDPLADDLDAFFADVFCAMNQAQGRRLTECPWCGVDLGLGMHACLPPAQDHAAGEGIL